MNDNIDLTLKQLQELINSQPVDKDIIYEIDLSELITQERKHDDE